MDFSLQTVEGEKLRYYESETDSSIQLVFLPGLFNPEIWRHQLRYFSSNFRAVSFDCLKGIRECESQRYMLEKVLDQDSMENVVLVSHGWSNPVAQQVEHREEVVATVLTGLWKKPPVSVPRRAFRLTWSLGFRSPKVAKKLFFSEVAQYRCVKSFLEDIERPSYAEYESFIENPDLRKPVKNCLVVYPENDRFSDREIMEKLKPAASISTIKSAGSFPFYEKPEEYNKALLDFLRGLEGFVEKRQLKKVQDRNRTLKDFEAGKPVIKQ